MLNRCAMAHIRAFNYCRDDSLRDDVVEWCHPKTGHHSPATLFRQQLMPDHFLRFERMLRLNHRINTYYY